MRYALRKLRFLLVLRPGQSQMPAAIASVTPVRKVAASLIKMAVLDWPVPDYTTLYRRQQTLSVELGGRSNSGGLHLLVDSTGLKMTGEGGWKTRKHGASYRPPVAQSFILGLMLERWISRRSR